MKETAIISDIEPGEVFDWAGLRWIKLCDKEDTTSILTLKPVKTCSFGNTDNWRKTDLRKYLNCDFREELIEAGAKEEDFKAFISYLTDKFGDDTHDRSKDYIALISLREAKRYIREGILDDLGDFESWWTLTPYRSGGKTVMIVSGLGNIGHTDTKAEAGVRAYCRIKQDTEVEV